MVFGSFRSSCGMPARTCTNSNVDTVCRTPSSSTSKSLTVRSLSGAPFSVAKTSTRTKFASVRKVGGCCWSCGGGGVDCEAARIAVKLQARTAAIKRLGMWSPRLQGAKRQAGRHSLLLVVGGNFLPALLLQAVAVQPRPANGQPLLWKHFAHQDVAVLEDLYFHGQAFRVHNAANV